MKQISLLLLAGAFVFIASCNNTPQDKATTTQPATSEAVTVPQVINYQLVNVYPHDPTCFTEGLQYVNGQLYESAGQYGASDIRKVDLQTGKVLQHNNLEKKYFGEGITVLNGRAYQLTYREGTMYVYDAGTLELLDFYNYTGEGWGMTTDGTYLIYSDGTNVIRYMDPNTFQQVKQLNVTDEHGPVQNINELELIKGSLYANQWQTDLILKIDTATGKVIARADLSDLRQKAGIPPLSQTDPKAPEVLNGIAYDSATNRIFVTGKYWPKLLEIRLDN